MQDYNLLLGMKKMSAIQYHDLIHSEKLIVVFIFV